MTVGQADFFAAVAALAGESAPGTPGPEGTRPLRLAAPGEPEDPSVTADIRPCPFCDQPITGHPSLALLESGELRWADTMCAIRMNGKRRSLLLPDLDGACA